MRSVFLFVIFFLLCLSAKAQSLSFAGRLIEYCPAPGQHINDATTGTPTVALGIVDKLGNPLSLGAYGGFVVLGFNSSIANDPENPYGVDFIIYGNASSTHAEPGIVEVMKDENENGIPDETWYEIAGSARFTDGYSKSYSINYQNINSISAVDIPWSDNSGNTGKVAKNSFHDQPYYPLKAIFPGTPQDELSFSGSILDGDVKIQNGIYVSQPYAFGYADNHPVIHLETTGIPDNPYTMGIVEGDGGDAIDISWAINSEGQYVDLQEIDFIRIYSGVNASAGWLGEISTDIRGIVDVNPNPDISGPLKMILTDDLPDKIALFDSVNITGRVFISGKPFFDEKILWESVDPSIIQISDNVIIAKTSGDVEIKGSLISDPSIFVKIVVKVVVPESLTINDQNIFLLEGESLNINYLVADNFGEAIIGLMPEIIVEDEMVAGVIRINDDHIAITGRNAGTTMIRFFFRGYPQLNKSFEIRVNSKTDLLSVSFSLTNGDENILPGRLYTVGKTDFWSFTDRYEKAIHSDKPYITLADAIVSVLKSEGFGGSEKSVVFRQDQYGGDGLYIWQVGNNWEYQYGWGGSNLDDIHAKTWFAIINNQVFASGFDTIEIYEGDKISLHHIEDNRVSWDFIRLIPEREQINIDEEVNFRTEQIAINPGNPDGFIVSGPYPVVNGPILVETSIINSGSDYYTSYSGEFKLSFNQGGIHEVSIENSVPIMVEVMFPLSTHKFEQISVFPNPFNEFLTVRFPSETVSGIRVYAIDGNLQFEKNIDNKELSMSLDLNGLERGIYILELVSSRNILRQKIYKL